MMPAQGYTEWSCKLESTRAYCGKEKPCKEKGSDSVEIVESGAITIPFDPAQEMKLLRTSSTVLSNNAI